MIKAGIVGGTGYTGVELLRLLLPHPHVQLTAITSRTEAGVPVDRIFPGLRGRTSLTYQSPEQAGLQDCDVVFFATPNGVAMKEAGALLDAGVRVVDLSADFRLRDAAEWEHWYKVRHAAPALLKEAVYGLCELNRDRLRSARLVANPGCYPTAVQLGLLPLVLAGVIDVKHMIADAKSGVSGAGRKTETHLMYAEATDNFAAYGVAGHRHWPEIRQSLRDAAGQDVGLVFTPHLTPMIRGIHATLYGRLSAEAVAAADADPDHLQSLFETRYAREPFVDVLPPGSHPDTRSVRAANTCRIAVHRPHESGTRRDTVVVLAVIDNLVKGASGQAVQNMNIMFGLDETCGLDGLPVVP